MSGRIIMRNRTVIEKCIVVVGNQLQHSQGGSFSAFSFGNMESLKSAVKYCGMPKRITAAVVAAFPEYKWG